MPRIISEPAKSAIPQPETWEPGFTEDRSKFRFLHKGHRFTLFKRPGYENWYVKFKHENRQKAVCTGTANVASAKLIAVTEWDKVLSGEAYRQKEREKAERGHATIGELIATYRSKIRTKKNLKEATVKENAEDLLRLVRSALGLERDADVSKQKTTILTAELVRKFQDARRAGVLEKSAVEQGRANLTMDSILASAKSLFTPEAMECYRQADLNLPDLKGFKEARKVKGYHATRYVPIPQETIDAMEKDMNKRRKSEPAMYLAYRLMLRLGLRNEEAAAARLDWIEKVRVRVIKGRRTTEEAIPMLGVLNRENFVPKNKLDRRIPIPDDLMADFKELIPEGAEYLIPCQTETERRFVTDRQLCSWVAGFLPDREKKAYELRKHFGAIVAATQGIYKAQEYLGHKSVVTTESHYASWLSQLNSRPMQIHELVPPVAKSLPQ